MPTRAPCDGPGFHGFPRGRLAYFSGRFTYSVVAGRDEGATITGHHVTVLRRQGTDWRIRSHVFSVE